MKRVILALFVACYVQISVAQSTEEPSRFIIIDVGEILVQIEKYTAKYQAGPTDEGILHTVYYQNISERTLVAVEMGFVSYSVFNELINISKGVDMAPPHPGKYKQMNQLVRFEPSDFAFYTGVVYVSRVRFASGEIWEADTAVVVDALLEIDATFDASRISP